jgi:hypothetical protein
MKRQLEVIEHAVSKFLIRFNNILSCFIELITFIGYFCDGTSKTKCSVGTYSSSGRSS